MLSKDDYRDYLKQLLKVENNMANIYLECAEKVEDEEIKKTLLSLVDREKEHAWNVAKLAGYLDL